MSARIPKSKFDHDSAFNHRLVAATASAHVSGGTFLADQFSKNHDEQLTYDNPPTSKNSDGFSL